jgi:transglutaminase-like putative cysteine protease
MSTVYRVTHRTEYSYESTVTASYGQLHLIPRESPGQRCSASDVWVDPLPDDYRERIDFFGNRVGYFAIHAPHEQLTVVASSRVEVDERPAGMTLFGHRPWEEVRDAAAAGELGDPVDVAQYLLDSPLVAAGAVYRNYALRVFTPGRNLVEAVAALSSQIHAEFEYRPGSTSVATPLATAFEQRKGVCQDFAQLGIACVRSLGLPARYVSGYLETDPPPGRPKLTGVDGSHAWLSVPVPDAGWIDIDPTNDQFVSSRYIVTAIGRDYSDVPPMNGVIYTEGRTEGLKVTVDVVAES